jgi:hypothetical protein
MRTRGAALIESCSDACELLSLNVFSCEAGVGVIVASARCSRSMRSYLAEQNVIALVRLQHKQQLLHVGAATHCTSIEQAVTADECDAEGRREATAAKPH